MKGISRLCEPKNAKLSFITKLQNALVKVQRGKDLVPACQEHELGIKARNKNIIHQMSNYNF